ncbi:isochorismatase hydrolase [Candidatus Syntrophocurvum alkaliphilum]|uniref:Isochorismatase hydrolase n=1 Tax=Candidatus Syntrophocurvum alkaliphilum TaxID=2293317 RepID=A0A6I6DM24_9FIRM|nr:isochorismatase family cysteine hydrolase [Candidatus Syntrophocurvum alkaliphilum]QGU00152.1 isochorismatase hydrolase [Candidatus Syntrophocurvum alkaliphilum]
MKLNETALLLIDLQKETKYDLLELDNVISNTKELISQCRKLEIPIIYTRHINRQDCVGLAYKDPLDKNGEPIFYNSNTDSIEIFDEIKPEQEDIVIDKHRWSGFYQTSLDLTLKSLNTKHLIIGGLVTDGCLMTSVFDAFANDYQVNLVKDICSTTNIGAHMSSILIMSNWVYGIEVYDTKELIKKLDGKNYKAWKWTEPDELKFDDNNIAEVFQQLNK